MQTLKIGEQRIAYALEGPVDAPVLVLSNSLGTSMAMWQAQAKVLSQHFRVLRYDTRGHGGSSTAHILEAEFGYELSDLGGDVLAMLDALNIAKFSFCGISMGGLIGLWLGANAGNRLERLIVANSAAKIGTEAGWLERASAVRIGGMDQVADGAAARWFTPEFRNSSPELVAPFIEVLRSTRAAEYAACCVALAHADLRPDLQRIVVPTLLVAGRWDMVTTVADAEYIAARIADSRCVELDASHLSNVEAVQGFTSEISEFLHRH